MPPHMRRPEMKQIFDENIRLYAVLALALIGAQGVLLQMLTSALMRGIGRILR